MPTIGGAARRAGVGVQTLRFYEREGLLEPAPRTESGYRIYDDAAIARVAFIRRAQQLGFSLREIRELLALQMSGVAECGDVRDVVATKLEDIERRIEDLARMKAALSGLVETCTGTGPAERCIIIDSIASRVM